MQNLVFNPEFHLDDNVPSLSGWHIVTEEQNQLVEAVTTTWIVPTAVHIYDPYSITSGGTISVMQCIPITETNVPYTASVYVKYVSDPALTSPIAISLYLEFTETVAWGNSRISVITTGISTPTEWTRIFVTGIAPSNAHVARIRLYASTKAICNHLLTGVQLVQSDQPLEYFSTLESHAKTNSVRRLIDENNSHQRYSSEAFAPKIHEHSQYVKLGETVKYAKDLVSTITVGDEIAGTNTYSLMADTSPLLNYNHGKLISFNITATKTAIVKLYWPWYLDKYTTATIKIAHNGKYFILNTVENKEEVQVARNGNEAFSIANFTLTTDMENPFDAPSIIDSYQAFITLHNPDNATDVLSLPPVTW